MRNVDCEFEADVLTAVMQSRWPERVDAVLRSHVQGCEVCASVAAIAGVIDADHDRLRASAVIPNSGKVWWLAQMRARREAEAAAARPITAVQVIAFACAIALMGACFGATSTWFQSILKSLGKQDFLALLAAHAALGIGMATILLVLPAAVFLAIRRD